MIKAIIKYLRNWIELLKRDRSRILHKFAIGIKFYPEWKRSLKKGKDPLNDRVPWIPFEARYFIESLLKPEATVFEYGIGGSTLFYSERVKQVISVEHDVKWFNRVTAVLAEKRMNNCTCFLTPPESSESSNENIDDPRTYRSGDESYRNFSFQSYVSSIDSFPDQFFDFVAVDGRARPSCLYHCHRKVKTGGYLTLDDSDRSHYQLAKKLLSRWQKYEFYGPAPYVSYFKKNTIWKRLRT